MAQKELIKYVKTCFEQGYDTNTIGSMLQNAGYTRYEVKEALKEARKKEKTKIITTKTIMILFTAIIALIIILIITLKLTAAPAQLELALKSYKTELTLGEELIIIAEINNPSGKKIKAMIDAEITGPEGKEKLPTKSTTLTDKASIPLKITINEENTPGTYTITVLLSYNRQTKTKVQQFIVKEKSTPATEAPTYITKEEQTIKKLQTCPENCDDLNRCTEDECINGRCMHKPTTPCCGNNFCEPEEDINNCPQDCRKQIKKMPTQCQEIPDQKEADNCFRELAEETTNKENCQYIKNEEIRDTCYMSFAYQKDFSICDQITNKYTKNTCYTLRNLVEAEEKTKS